MDKNLITVKQMANDLIIAPSTIYNWIDKDLLPFGIVLPLGKADYKIRKNVLERIYDINISDGFYTLEEIAKELDKTLDSAREWTKSNYAPKDVSFKIVGITRIRKKIFDKFIAGEPLDEVA